MTEPNKRKILITAALPYANGDIHLGHLIEHCTVDFWARFQKMRGQDCLMLCADDTHGTPIMVSARQRGITPEALIAQARLDHIRDFAGFEIVYDQYSSTHTPTNRALSEEIYRAMVKNGHVAIRGMKQLYCEHDQMFLPDRLVMGTCPRCSTPDQYGDVCEKCSATYSTTELKEPRCSLCSKPPVIRETEHSFFKLNDFRDFLSEWVPGHTPREVGNKLATGLKNP